ncbi:MAG: efflux RND transporter periplasmic adaptor subunit [Pseudomonadota bacterium]
MMIMRVWPLIFIALFSASLSAAELQGDVRWADPLTLSTNLNAEVMQAKARIGQHVTKGELLVQLENGVLRAHQAQARAELVHQKLLRAEARNELQRSEELYERTLLSDHDLDLARIAHAAAESGYQRAAAELKAAQRAVELSRIVAPFDGLVVERQVQAGETVNGQFKSVSLYTLVEADKRLVSFVMEATQAVNITVGDELELQIGERRYAGVVDAISWHRGKEVATRVTIDILFTPGKKEPVAIGTTARVRLP